jgi:hypothetical protein
MSCDLLDDLAVHLIPEILLLAHLLGNTKDRWTGQGQTAELKGGAVRDGWDLKSKKSW